MRMILRKEQLGIGLLAVLFLSILVFASDKRDQRSTGAVSEARCAGCKPGANAGESYVLLSNHRVKKDAGVVR